MNENYAKDTHASFAQARIVPTAFVLVLFFFSALFLSVNNAQAAPKKGFESLQVSGPPASFSMQPGEVRTVQFKMKNIGTKSWRNAGYGHISFYTYAPKYRVSQFRHDSWFDYTQASILKESSVPVGGVGTLDLVLKAPKYPGVYKETFQLAAENAAWVPGGEMQLTITVGDVAVPTVVEEIIQPDTPSVKDGSISPETDGGLSATILLRSKKKIVAEGGESVSYKIGVKNTGTTPWTSREIRTSDIAIATATTKHTSWVSSTKLVSNTNGVVKPGALDFLEFTFNAPNTKGLHTIRYRMAVNDEVIPDFYIDIPVEVTSGSGQIIEAPKLDTQDGVVSEKPIDEPHVRIGFLIVDEETQNQVEISCDTDWKLMGGDGSLLGNMKADQMVRAFYKNQRYYFNRGDSLEQTHNYLRFVPNSPDAICTVENFDRRVTRNAAHADNTFRDVLELRYNPTKDRTWVINELPVEEYLYGLAETSNISPHEYKKALVVVARTYALYHWERGTKHKNEFFHMNSYADDQVYKGYGHETRNPKIGEATRDTEGVVVNYQGETAITPYFSRSDGRTRDWGEVWNGSVPWIKSVKTPCDAKYGRTLWGHGVGLSATEALCMAKEQDKQWDEILHYFYQDIDLNKRWEKGE